MPAAAHFLVATNLKKGKKKKGGEREDRKYIQKTEIIRKVCDQSAGNSDVM